jgi:hypothetical protein
MRDSNRKTLLGSILRLSAIASAALVVALLTASVAAAQTEPCTQPDHLKCYHVAPDQFKNRALLSLDSPQFGVEPGCVVEGPAILFCVPACKTVILPPPPSGTGFQAKTTLLDDELCYHVHCRVNNAPKTLGVEDQFAQRTVGLGPAELLCAPAEKVSPPPPCGFTPPNAMGPNQCGGACPPGLSCQFTPGQPGTTVEPASCNCQQTTTPCGLTGGSATAPSCGGACPATANGTTQLCRQLGTNCMCTPF